MPEFQITHVLKPSQYQTLKKELSIFAMAYVTAALFTEEENLKESFDAFIGDPEDGFSLEFSDQAIQQIKTDCAEFLTLADGILEPIRNEFGGCTVDEHAGRDFWYTRNGHGCGFWDGEEMWEHFDKGDDKALTKLAKEQGEVDLYMGDDGKLHF